MSDEKRAGKIHDPEYHGDCDDGFDDEWDEEEAAFEDDIENCGRLPAHLGGGCQLAGTEYCDFDCPFRDNPW